MSPLEEKAASLRRDEIVALLVSEQEQAFDHAQGRT
jgi:hypothetical protein